MCVSLDQIRHQLRYPLPSLQALPNSMIRPSSLPRKTPTQTISSRGLGFVKGHGKREVGGVVLGVQSLLMMDWVPTQPGMAICNIGTLQSFKGVPPLAHVVRIVDAEFFKSEDRADAASESRTQIRVATASSPIKHGQLIVRLGREEASVLAMNNVVACWSLGPAHW